MNERCVTIKVDRGERPDVDRIYMDALQIIIGLGIARAEADTQTMRPVRTFLLLALFAASCGAPPGSGNAGAPGTTTLGYVDHYERACLKFIEQTEPLQGESNHAAYQDVLGTAIAPVVRTMIDQGDLGDQTEALAASLERMYAGDATREDLWAIEEIGGLMAPISPICEELGRNVGYMPPPPGESWDQPPPVSVDSDYESGTAEHSCDMFIQTISAWMPDASTGAEYGPSMADVAEKLIVELATFGVDEATPPLTVVAEKWRTQPWFRAAEETYEPLVEASSLLAEAGVPRCGELTQAFNIDAGPEAPHQDRLAPVVEVDSVSSFDPGQACGNASVLGGMAIPDTQPLDVDAQQAVAALTDVGEEGAGFTDSYAYQIFSRTDDVLILLGTSADGSLSEATFDRVDGVWKPSGWGSCQWQSAGYTPVNWELHPELPVNPLAPTVHLLAVDNCGSVASNGHLVIVVATFEEDKVTFAVHQSLRPPHPTSEFSDLSCPLGATVHLVVHVPEPIGDRLVIGQSTVSDN